MTTFKTETFRDEIEKELKKLLAEEKKHVVSVLNESSEEFIDTAVLYASNSIGIAERDINKSQNKSSTQNTFYIQADATNDRKYISFIVKTLKISAKKLTPKWSKQSGLTLTYPKISANQNLFSITKSQVNYPHAFPIEKFKSNGLYYQRKSKERFPIKSIEVDYDPTQLKVFFNYKIFQDIIIEKFKQLK